MRARVKLWTLAIIGGLGLMLLPVTFAACARAATAPLHKARAAAGAMPVRLPGHVLGVLARARRMPAVGAPGAPMTLTLTLRRDDQAGFERFLGAVYDRDSPEFHRFTTPRRLADRFGPSRRTYAALRDYLSARGLKVVETSTNRMTLTVRGSRAIVNRVLGTDVADYRDGKLNFYANSQDPVLPAALARHVQAIAGLSNFARPRAAQELETQAALSELDGLSNAFTLEDIFNTFLGPDGDLDKILDTANLLNSIAEFASASTVERAMNPPAYKLHTTPFICPLSPFLSGAGIALGPLYARLANAASVVLYFTPSCNPLTHNSSSAGAGPGAGAGTDARALSVRYPSAVPPPWSAVDGTGQTIGLVEFDTLQMSDVADYLALVGRPAAQINQVTQVHVNGGAAPGAEQDEALLDVDVSLMAAPGAKVVVYDAPGPAAAGSFQAVFNRMITDGVSIISNSWHYCEDQTTQADAASIDAILATAAAAGISVFNATGDSGSTCSDGSAATVSVPADSPHATAVGGTTLHLDPSGGYGSETWWDGSNSPIPSGQGGFGVSRFFARPAYQSGLNSQANRSVPDVSVNADPNQGIVICQASAGGCPSGSALGGTSSATPLWAAFQALLNQAAGTNMGFVNTAYYPLAATAAFHNAASMGSDFSHVGLGSPNLDALHLLAGGQNAGAADAGASQVTALVPAASLLSNATPPVVPDDGTTAIVRVQLFDINGNTAGGRSVSLAGNAGTQATITPASGVTSANDGSVVFTVKDLSPEVVTFTATDTSDSVTLATTAALNFTGPPPTAGGVNANPTSIAADGASTATITVTLQDSLGRGVPGKQISLAQGTAHSIIQGPSPSLTDAGGKIQFTVTDSTSETVTYSALDVTDAALAVPGSAQVTFGAGVGGTPPCASMPSLQVAPGYSVTSYATGFVQNGACEGPVGLALSAAGELYVGSFATGGLYHFHGGGGTAQPATSITPTPSPLAGDRLSGLAFSKDGQHLYAALQASSELVELDPGTGAVLRLVAYLTNPTGVAVDPISGDVFVSEAGSVGFDAVIERVANPQAATPVVTDYVTNFYYADGITFAPDGTLYAAAGGAIYRIAGTNVATPGAPVKIAAIPQADGIAVETGPANSQATALFVNDNAGNMTKVDLTQTPAALSTVFTGGSRGDFVAVDANGCAYVTQSDQVLRLTNADGSCSLSTSSAALLSAPALVMSPAIAAPNPALGTSQTLTATFKNLTVAPGTPVYFLVTGANPQVKQVRSDANGAATFTYSATAPGVDVVVASASVPLGTPPTATSLASGTARVTWTAGPHTTFLSLNLSPRGGTPGKAVTVVGSLFDLSLKPIAAADGQLVNFAIGSSTCSATTGANGSASCSLMPAQSGAATLRATFAGTTSLQATAAAAGFSVLAAAAPPPTVTIGVSPATIAAGAAATVTWASTDSSSCTASGAWSGAEAVSGAQVETPAAPGSYTYTLTCSGAGGTAAASAVLSANLVPVVVTARSGGGALDARWLLLLGALVLCRVLLQWRSARLSGSLFVLCMIGCLGSLGAHAQSVGDPGESDGLLNRLYVGARVGAMPLELNAADIDRGLAARGYPNARASAQASGIGATYYVGFDLTRRLDLELGFTHRQETVARVSGTVASADAVAPLLHATTDVLRGYGSIYAISLRWHQRLGARFALDSRLGAFAWDTTVTATAGGSRIRSTHGGGGATAGVGVSYRVWRDLEIGLGADYFHGTPRNVATLYGGTLEWRFGAH